MSVRRILFVTLIAFFGVSIHAHASATVGVIDPNNAGNYQVTVENPTLITAGTQKINFGKFTTQSAKNITVTSTELRGYAWGEATGYIVMNCADTTSGCTGTNGNFKVANDGTGILSGYAWGDSTGWINFGPFTNASISRVKITNGLFGGTLGTAGYAWTQTYGFIKFDCSVAGNCVETDWRPATIPPPGGGGGGGGGNPCVINPASCNPPSCATNPALCPQTCDTNPAICTPPPDACTLHPESCVTPPDYCTQHPKQCLPPSDPCTTNPASCLPPPQSCATNPALCPPPDACTTNPAFCLPPADTCKTNPALCTPAKTFCEQYPSLCVPPMPKDVPLTGTVPRIIQFGGLVAALVGAALLFLIANPYSFYDIFLMLARLWSLLLVAFGIKKKNKPWGTVYDSVTKQPIDPAYVVLTDMQGNEITTSITDIEGRYGFAVPKGMYLIKVSKTNYAFPSVKLAGRFEDELYRDLYFGEPIEVTEDGGIIAKNIPMDQLNFDWNEYAKNTQNRLKHFRHKEIIISRISGALFIAGFIFSAIATVISPIVFNIIVLALYILMAIARVMKFTLRPKGSVLHKDTKQALPFSIVRIISTVTGREIMHKVADARGEYYALLPNGNYRVTVDTKNADATYTTNEIPEEKTVKKGYLKEKIKV